MDSVVSWHTSRPTIDEPMSRQQASGDTLCLPVLEPGTLLEPYGVYLDLNNPARGPFRAIAGQVAGSGNRYVAQRDVPWEVWQQLVERAAIAAIPEEKSKSATRRPILEALLRAGEMNAVAD